MLIYNCSREEVIVGLGLSHVEGDDVWKTEGTNGPKREIALLDGGFYVVEVFRQGEEEAASGCLTKASYILEAERLRMEALGRGDRLALVWGW